MPPPLTPGGNRTDWRRGSLANFTLRYEVPPGVTNFRAVLKAEAGDAYGRQHEFPRGAGPRWMKKPSRDKIAAVNSEGVTREEL